MKTFTVYEAARELGCTSQWIRVLLAERRLQGARKVAGQWQIPATALHAMKQHRQGFANGNVVSAKTQDPEEFQVNALHGGGAL